MISTNENNTIIILTKLKLKSTAGHLDDFLKDIRETDVSKHTVKHSANHGIVHWTEIFIYNAMILWDYTHLLSEMT